MASNSLLYEPGEHPDHVVVIKYVPYVGDSKRAMDEYTSEIFLGGTNTIVMHNTCEVGACAGGVKGMLGAAAHVLLGALCLAVPDQHACNAGTCAQPLRVMPGQVLASCELLHSQHALPHNRHTEPPPPSPPQDSLLAAPIILDLVILAELITRIELRKDGEPAFHGFHPVAVLLSYLTKAPLVPQGTPVVNALSKQRAMLENVLRACVGMPPESNMMMEFKC